MIFSRWKPYPKRKPKKDGSYLCTIAYDEEQYLVKLYYDRKRDAWINRERQSVFDGYKVFKACREPIADNRVFTDSLCEPGHVVIAFRRLPKTYDNEKI